MAGGYLETLRDGVERVLPGPGDPRLVSVRSVKKAMGIDPGDRPATAFVAKVLAGMAREGRLSREGNGGVARYRVVPGKT